MPKAEPQCSTCKTTKNLHAMHQKKGYVQYRCRSCGADYQRKWRASHRAKQLEYERVKRHRGNTTNAHQRPAWTRAAKIPLKPCEVCGDPKSMRHHDDYSKPLHVRFLCALHHRQAHVL